MCVNKKEKTQKRETHSVCSGVGEIMRQEEYGTWRTYEEGPCVEYCRLAASKKTSARKMRVES